MANPIHLATNQVDTYEQFNLEIQKLAVLGNESNIALVTKVNEIESIEIKTATWWDRVVKWLGWECLGGKEYQESEVQRVMGIFLDNNQNFVEQAFKERNIPLSNDRIFKYIPHNYFCNFLNRQITMIDSLRSNANSKIGELEKQITQADLRKGQIENDIIMLKSSRNRLIGESIPKNQPTHEPRSYQKSQFMEALREDTKNADIILISSDGKEIHAYSTFLNDSEYFSNFEGDFNFFTNSNEKSIVENNTQAEKCTFNFTDPRFDAATINHFLDLKYGIPLSEKLTQAQIINLLYFARYVLDESLKDELLVTLFKDLNEENSEVLLPGLFDVVLDFTEDLAKQFKIFDKVKNLLISSKTSIKSEWFELLLKHKDSNSPNINYWLGFCYYKGIGVAIDKHSAFMSWKSAGEQGYALAQNGMGTCYHNGQGVESDPEMALYWYTLAADKGYAPAQYSVSISYYKGNGVKKNLEIAFHQVKLAADQGYGPAQCGLAECYYRGLGVEKNFEEAIKWSSKTAKQKNKKGLEVLSSIWGYQH